MSIIISDQLSHGANTGITLDHDEQLAMDGEAYILGALKCLYKVNHIFRLTGS